MHTDVQSETRPMEQLRKITWALLEHSTPPHSLRAEIAELTKIFGDAQIALNTWHEKMSGVEFRTSDGLAISPTLAMNCADDFVRTTKFLRGIYDAIGEIRKRFPSRPAQILYVGCGPYATLAVPLMSVISPGVATFTLLDVQPQCTRSVKSIVAALGLNDHVSSINTMNAMSYRVSAENPPDVILMEIMQACLESEPQVAITRHLVKQAPHAILIPEEVRVDIKLLDPSLEIGIDSFEQHSSPVHGDRTSVAPVFTVNRHTVKSWDNLRSDHLPASLVRIPDTLEQRYQPMLFTTIHVYGNHILTEYDCGLTCPRLPSVEGKFRPGSRIQFQYLLGSRPRLRGKVLDRTRSQVESEVHIPRGGPVMRSRAQSIDKIFLLHYSNVRIQLKLDRIK